MKCISCLQGFTWECEYHGNCDGRNGSANLLTVLPNPPIDSLTDQLPAVPVQTSSIEGGENDDNEFEFNVNTQDDSKLRDQQSTGRKRAAILFPLVDGGSCEWKRSRNCGGGSSPIVGCLNGIQQARHHGPDKNTLNNSKGNVHRICHTCHNRWHTLNDADYIWGSNYEPHSPITASGEELLEGELFWAARTVSKAKD